MAATKNLDITQGKTFTLVLRWETEPVAYKAITAIQQTAPVRMAVAGHGAPDGWRGAVTSVKGMTEINAADQAKLRDSDYHAITVIDANTVEFNDVNAAGFKPYASGGYLQYNTPVDLTDFVARMEIKDKVGGTLLASADVVDAPLNILDIAIDNTKKTITLTINATDTAALTWKRGVYDLEMQSATGVVTALITGTVSVTKEVTT